MSLPEAVDGDPGLDQAALDLGGLLARWSRGQRDGQPVLADGDAGCDRALAEGAGRRERIGALHLDGHAGAFGQLADRPLADHLAVVDDGYRVAGAFYLVEQVG